MSYTYSCSLASFLFLIVHDRRLGQGTGAQCSPYYKEHLSLVIVRQQEESRDGIIGNFIVKSLPMKLEKGGIRLDCVATPMV